MSPEQLDGKASSSSDIFGLGLTLYEMLTLQPAYPGIDKRRLLEKVAEANPTGPRSIDSRIPKDLETIVMKCIQRDPAKRYESAADVGEDLGRFIEGQPIEARRINFVEKSWKWCCRRPTLAASFAALAISIGLGIAGVGWQWRNTAAALSVSQTNFEKAKHATEEANKATAKANNHYQQARSAVVQITESISNEELLTSPDLLPVRLKLLKKALAYQIDFVKSHPGDVNVKIELAEAYVNLASASSKLAKTDESKQYLKDARGILESLLKQELQNNERERSNICLADTYALSGEIALRSTPDGQSYLHGAIRILLDGREEASLSDAELLKLAALYRRLGTSFEDQNLGRSRPIRMVNVKALEYFTKAFDTTTLVANNRSEDWTLMRNVASDHRHIGMANRRLRNNEKALEHYTASVDQFRDLVAAEPENTDFRLGLAEALSSLAFYQSFAERDVEASLATYKQSIHEYQTLSEAYPSVLKFIVGESRVTVNCCLVYENEKRSKEAIKLRERTIELSKKALMFAPDDPKLLSDYGRVLMGYGLNKKRRGKREEALELLLLAKEQHKKAVSKGALTPTYRIRLGRTIHNIAFLYRGQDDFELSYKTFLEAITQKPLDAEVVYLTGRGLLTLARDISTHATDNKGSDSKLADKAIASAKDLFSNLLWKNWIHATEF
jgi:tetratricopeptide (TPR) repeat protein